MSAPVVTAPTKGVSMFKWSTYMKGAVVMAAAALLVLLPLALPASAAAFSDGNFETPVVAPPFVTFTSPATIGPWSVTSGSVDLVNSYWQAADGVQSVDLSGTSAGTICQVFDTPQGGLVTVTFALSHNPDGGNT